MARVTRWDTHTSGDSAAESHAYAPAPACVLTTSAAYMGRRSVSTKPRRMASSMACSMAAPSAVVGKVDTARPEYHARTPSLRRSTAVCSGELSIAGCAGTTFSPVATGDTRSERSTNGRRWFTHTGSGNCRAAIPEMRPTVPAVRDESESAQATKGPHAEAAWAVAVSTASRSSRPAAGCSKRGRAGSRRDSATLCARSRRAASSWPFAAEAQHASRRRRSGGGDVIAPAPGPPRTCAGP
mmetsp:Transcript_24637/g.67015  ORF Transcript_24637/g.67015 Transcript_24637/m.67015 type:complete len:241 (-) Transcript_24637:1068-1790(-)